MGATTAEVEELESDISERKVRMARRWAALKEGRKVKANKSRDWKKAAPHDGMSFMIHHVEFVLEGSADRGVGRDAKSRKARMALESQKRRDAAAALLMLPDRGSAGLVNGALATEA